jgi:hypothetical protein
MIGWVEGCLQCYPHPVFRLDMQGCCFYITSYRRPYCQPESGTNDSVPQTRFHDFFLPDIGRAGI